MCSSHIYRNIKFWPKLFQVKRQAKLVIWRQSEEKIKLKVNFLFILQSSAISIVISSSKRKLFKFVLGRLHFIVFYKQMIDIPLRVPHCLINS